MATIYRISIGKVKTTENNRQNIVKMFARKSVNEICRFYDMSNKCTLLVSTCRTSEEKADALYEMAKRIYQSKYNLHTGYYYFYAIEKEKCEISDELFDGLSECGYPDDVIFDMYISTRERLAITNERR